MTQNKGLSPKSMGLIFMYDDKNNHDYLDWRNNLIRYNGALNLEQAVNDVYGSMYGIQGPTRNKSRQFDTIPLKYQGGLLVVAKSPEPGYNIYNSLVNDTLKGFIERQTNGKKKGYVGTVPEEVDWFYVNDIEVYLSDSDSVRHADDATIDVMNYYGVPKNGGILLSQGNPLKMTSTVDDGRNKGMYIDRNESAMPLQGAIGESAIRRKTDSPLYPKKTFDVDVNVRGQSGQVSFISGLIDEVHKMDRFGRNEQLLVMYPDGPDVYKTTTLINPDDFYYQGNKLFQLEVSGERNSKHFLSQKLQTISGASLRTQGYNVNELNINTLTNSNLDGGIMGLHGMDIFHRSGNLWTNSNHQRMNYIPMNYDPLTIYNYSLPSFSARTPINLGKEYRDTQLKTMDTILLFNTIKSLSHVFLDGILDVLTGIYVFDGLSLVTSIVTSIGGIMFDLANREATLTDLDNSYSDELHVAESSSYAITSDRGERWSYTIPQTEIVQFKNGESRRNKDNPFYKVPINKLFKSVPEFYDYVADLGIGDFQKVNLEPYINSEYDRVWELWSQMRHHKAPAEYSYRDTHLGYFKRRLDDANIDY